MGTPLKAPVLRGLPRDPPAQVACWQPVYDSSGYSKQCSDVQRILPQRVLAVYIYITGDRGRGPRGRDPDHTL